MRLGPRLVNHQVACILTRAANGMLSTGRGDLRLALNLCELASDLSVRDGPSVEICERHIEILRSLIGL